MDIKFDHVSYTYQANTPFAHNALEDISLSIPDQAVVAIVGHTGSGKSTFLQHLNGLKRPTSGTIHLGGYILSRDKKPKDMKTLRSKVGVVFQYPEYQLFEETVRQDIAFGPKNFGYTDAEIQEETKILCEMLNIDEDMLARSPFELSGGQKRRVAIAGVLASKPEVLVLDEPTAGLDPRGHHEIMDSFMQLHDQQNLTTVLVTHHMEDVLKYADYMIVLDKGKKYMEGKPKDVLLKKEVLQKVGLDLPAMYQFIADFEDKFKTNIENTPETISQLADEIYKNLNGRD